MGNSSSYGVDPATIKTKIDVVSDGELFIHPRSYLLRRHRAGKQLNNTAVNSPEAVSSDTIEHAQNDFIMERFFLQKNNNVPIGRSSSPTRKKCFHCAHGHAKPCCLYLGDHPEDAERYAKWKKHLEHDDVRPGHFPRVPEAVSGGSTPSWFPKGTYCRERDINRLMKELNPPPPVVFLRKYSLPLLSYGKEFKMLENQSKKITPYKEYKRELARQKKKAVRPFLINFTPKTEQKIEAVENIGGMNPSLNEQMMKLLK